LRNKKGEKMLTPVVNIIVGILALLFGRKLFWLLVAIAGFVLGLSLTSQFLSGQPDWVVLLIALAGGLVGAILALVLQQVAVGIVGFVLGGYGLVSLVTTLGFQMDQWNWVVFIVGGIVGALLAWYLFDPALIGLSSLAGASLITGGLGLTSPLDLVVFLVLFLVGVAFQAGLMWREPPERRRVVRRS
jgi:hypothetical protein